MGGASWQERRYSTDPHTYISNTHAPNRLHLLVTHVIVYVHTFGSFTGSASFSFSSFTCCCAIPAYSMAEMRTSQVGGCLLPWPSLHLTSPACTISSSFKGWALKHASIVDVSRPTPSRTALALPAAFLLTYLLKSLIWSGQSADRAYKQQTQQPLMFLTDVAYTDPSPYQVNCTTTPNTL